MRSFRQSEKQKAVLKRTQKVVPHAGSSDIPLPFRDNDLLAYRNSTRVEDQDPPQLTLLLQDFHNVSQSLQLATDYNETGCINSLVRQELPIAHRHL